MGIVEAIGSALSEIITYSATGIGNGIEGLLFEAGAEGEMVLSQSGTAILTIVGLGFGIGLLYVVLNIIRV